jgi:hypothetical protein
LTVASISCNKLSPAGFWNNYHTASIVIKKSNQGPRGGNREIIWKSKYTHTFDKEHVISYAKKNGWQLTDVLAVKNDSLISFGNYEQKSYSFNILTDNVATLINKSSTCILIFKTGWIAIEPGNARETKKNGFAILNSDGTELAVYHLWGE